MEDFAKIKIFLAEDHPLMRQGIRHLLEQYPEFEVVGEVGDGEKALAMTALLHPDILLCDLRLPFVTGIDVVRRLKGISPGPKILMLSAFDDEVYKAESMRAGASAYLLKTLEPEELAQAIRKVYSRDEVIEPDRAKTSEQLEHQEYLQRLTTREWEILGEACRGSDCRGIATKLGLSTRTVEKHLGNIYKKLSVSSLKEAVQSVLNRNSAAA